MNNISKLIIEVDKLRTRYIKTEGKDWLLLAFTLKSLSETYRSLGMIGEARTYNEEYNSIIEKTQVINARCECLPEASICAFDDSDVIKSWAEKERKSREAIMKGGSVTKYAKTVNVLCGYLWPPIQSDNYPIGKERLEWAHMKYKEALDQLLSHQNMENIDKEGLFMIIVISLKLSECERELDNLDKARNYSLLSLYYLAQNNIIDEKEINMGYVAELCMTIIKKHHNN